MAEDRFQAMHRHILAEIWTSDEAYRNLAYLCDDLGHRFAGSDNEHRAADFLQGKMEAYGLENVRLETFPMAGWERGDCTLTLTEPVTRDISAIAMPYCPAADLEADVIDVGEGEQVDFERAGAEIRGKIVLTDAETNRPGERKSHRSDKYGWALANGAVACVFINRNPGLLHITGSLPGRDPSSDRATDREAPIPGIGITYEAGMAIRRLAERGVPRLRLHTTNRTFASVSHNVVGEIIGIERPNEVVLLGGHYDGHDISQGAGDDGAGTITGLEAGRALAGLKGRTKRTIRVICFGSEEVGLRGAWHHVRSRRSNETLRFVMNLDGAGRGSGGQEQMNVSGIDEIQAYFQRIAGTLPYAFDVRSELNAHSDHFPFAVYGIPNGTLSSRDTSSRLVGRGWGHTEADTLDKITLRGLQMAAILAARLALTISEDETFPSRVRTVDEVREQLRDAGLLQQLEQSGQFPPR